MRVEFGTESENLVRIWGDLGALEEIYNEDNDLVIGKRLVQRQSGLLLSPPLPFQDGDDEQAVARVSRRSHRYHPPPLAGSPRHQPASLSIFYAPAFHLAFPQSSYSSGLF